MAGGVEGEPGGIYGLCRELTAHGEAIEFDLITLGLRLDWLGTEALTWRDLYVILTRLPRSSAYAREVVGEDVEWGLAEHLLAVVVDVLQEANWQRASQGRKSPPPRPKPLPRPGATSEAQRFGSGALPIKDFDEWWESGG